MEQLLQTRETIISYYKRYEVFIVLAFKFILGVVIFASISGIGRPMPMLERFASPAGSIPLIILMSIVFAVTPINAGYMLITLNLCLQTSAVLEVAVVLAIFLFSVQGLYTRLAPTECVLILCTLGAYFLKLPYLVPIVAGLYFSITSIIPITIAVFMWQFMPVVSGMLQRGADTAISVGELTDLYQASYTQIVGYVSSNHDWIIISFIFAMVVVLVYAVSRAPIDHSKHIAIGLGGALSLISFIVAVLVTEIKIGLLGALFSMIVSVGLAYVVNFFDVVLDYQSVERVQFQDEDNVYYVRIVPKVVLPKAGRVVRTIRPEDDRAVRTIRPEDDRAVRTIRPEDDRAVRTIRPEDDRVIRDEVSQNTGTWAQRWEQIERERQAQERAERERGR